MRFEGPNIQLDADLAMTVEIVPIREDLIDSFHAALDQVCRERGYFVFLEAPPIEETRAFVRGNMAKGAPQLVAVHANRVVGWCDVSPVQRPTMRHSGMLGIGLLPDHRGCGLGERLIRKALKAARAFGFGRVELSVRHDNARALALYRKVGFEIEGRKRHAVLVDGVFHDLIIMGLLFDAATPVPHSAGQAL